MLPADAGCIVDNVDTVISIYMAVCKSTPLMRKIITITGDAVNTPCNFNVKLGTNYQELIEAAGGFKEEPEKIISGGPMMTGTLYRGYPCKQNFLCADLFYKGSGICPGAYGLHPLRPLRKRMSKPHCSCDDDAGSFEK